VTWTPPILPEGFEADPRTYRTPMASALFREVFSTDGARIIAVNGGIGSGKSYAIAQLIFAVAMARPGARILVGAGSLNLLMGVLYARCKDVFGEMAAWRGGIIHPRWEFANGSVAEFRAYKLPGTKDEAENPWEGRDCHLLLVDEVEQLPAVVLDHSLQRCRNSATDAAGHRFGPTVVWLGRPGAVDHWVRQATALRNQGRRVAIMMPRTADNPLIWERAPDGRVHSPYLENLRASMSPERFQCVTQDVPGATMPTEGAIFDCFAPELYPAGNLIDLEADGTSTTWAAIDFGINTTAVFWIQRRRVQGRAVDVIVDEWCPDTDTSTQRLVLELLSPQRPKAHELVVDPAGQAKSRASNLVSEVAILRRPVGHDPDGLGGGVGVPVIASHLDGEKGRVTAGIYRVQARMKDASGRRELLVRADLWNRPRGRRGIRHTIQQYRRGPDGEPLKGERGGHADHAADALRHHVIRNAWTGVDSSKPITNTGADTRHKPKSAQLRRAHGSGKR